MLEVFSSGDHNFSPKVVQAVAAATRDRGVRTMIPESAEGLSGPNDKMLVETNDEGVQAYREDHC